MMKKQERQLKDLEKNQIGLLHRQWIWADYMRIMYDAAFRASSRDILFNPMKFYVNQVGCYMCLWYSLLFSVLERLRGWGVAIETVQADIDGIYPSLEEFRNAIFHPPVKYWDKRLFNLFKKKGVGNQLRKIHNAIGELFWEVMSRPL